EQIDVSTDHRAAAMGVQPVARFRRDAHPLALEANQCFRRAAADTERRKEWVEPTHLMRDPTGIALRPSGVVVVGIGSASTNGLRLTCASASRARTNVSPLPRATAPPIAPPASFRNFRRPRTLLRKPHGDLLASRPHGLRRPFCGTELVDHSTQRS